MAVQEIRGRPGSRLCSDGEVDDTNASERGEVEVSAHIGRRARTAQKRVECQTKECCQAAEASHGGGSASGRTEEPGKAGKLQESEDRMVLGRTKGADWINGQVGAGGTRPEA